MRKLSMKKIVPWDLPGVPKLPILGPNCRMFSKLNGPGPLLPKGLEVTLIPFLAMADFKALRGGSAVM